MQKALKDCTCFCATCLRYNGRYSDQQGHFSFLFFLFYNVFEQAGATSLMVLSRALFGSVHDDSSFSNMNVNYTSR